MIHCSRLLQQRSNKMDIEYGTFSSSSREIKWLSKSQSHSFHVWVAPVEVWRPHATYCSSMQANGTRPSQQSLRLILLAKYALVSWPLLTTLSSDSAWGVVPHCSLPLCDHTPLYLTPCLEAMTSRWPWRRPQTVSGRWDDGLNWCRRLGFHRSGFSKKIFI